VAPSCVANAAIAGLGGTAALLPRTAVSTSLTASTIWKTLDVSAVNSSGVSARRVICVPPAVFRLMLIGASVLLIRSP
jgi:hypothetical protein